MSATILGDRDGKTYDHNEDFIRLNGQAADIWNFMADGNWHTPKEIEANTGHNWAAASARLRDFRKPKFGASIVERERHHSGLFSYRLTPSKTVAGNGI